jgi:APA family basic amino acid/polyamine antiporter
MRFVVASGGIAALGVGFATFLSAVIPLEGVWARSTLHLLGRDVPWQLGTKEVVGVTVVLLFGLLNCIGVRFGGGLQTALTTAKVAGILIIVGGAFLLSKSGSVANFAAPSSAPAGLPGMTRMTAFGAAVLSALWACDGWAFMPMVAGEVKNPGRNVPRALIVGVLSVLTLYGLANLAYFYVLPFNEVASSNSTLNRDALPVASKAAATFMGDRGPALLSIVFMISVAGALNGVILSMARIPFAMARNGVMFPKLGELGERSNAPVAAILAVTLWSCVLALSGTFDQLTDLTIFGQWIFYGITASAVFVLRRRMPDAPRPYKTLGYPLTPALFLIGAVLLLANTLRSSPVEAVVGLVLIALGLPVYFYYRSKK